MLAISGNNITLTRGDSAEIVLELTKNGDSFTPASGDVIKFYLSIGYKGGSSYNLLVEKTIDNQELLLAINPEDTDELNYGPYNYDLEITYASGAVDTFVSGKFTLTGECG